MWLKNTVKSLLPPITRIPSLERWTPLHEISGMFVENADTQAFLDPID